MEYIENENGDIKVINNEGVVKWFSKNMANDAHLMKTMKFEIVKKPISIEPIIEQAIEVTESEQVKKVRKIKNQ